MKYIASSLLVRPSRCNAFLVPGRTIFLYVLLQLFAQVALSTASVRQRSAADQIVVTTDRDLAKLKDSIPSRRQLARDVHKMYFRHSNIPTDSEPRASGSQPCPDCSPSVQGPGVDMKGTSALDGVRMRGFHVSPNSIWIRNYKASRHIRVPPSGPNPSGNDSLSEKSP
ncbi:hypothetical protein KP509_20G040900 [Ceratopteris richardii]|uniref:Uncharacterized protein n=1 Tax=Ceratopteris richardii TaxID=49495 RepID=A0A8T2SI00_CERRI|nr:hypothetical protein KP509_20G040900 [Ceratopteris richardii]